MTPYWIGLTLGTIIGGTAVGIVCAYQTLKASEVILPPDDDDLPAVERMWQALGVPNEDVGYTRGYDVGFTYGYNKAQLEHTAARRAAGLKSAATRKAKQEPIL